MTGALPVLVALLRSQEQLLQELAAKTLCDLMINCQVNKDAVVLAGNGLTCNALSAIVRSRDAQTDKPDAIDTPYHAKY